MKNKQTYIGILLSIGMIGFSTTALSQETSSSIVNEGVISVSTGDLVSFDGRFDNTDKGEVINDGVVLYFDDFINNGYYGWTKNKTSSKAIFITDVTDKIKKLQGNALSSFYNVEFKSPTKKTAFALENNIDVYGTVDFQEGIVKVDSLLNSATGLSNGMFSFQQGSKTANVDNLSHIEGQIEKIGNEIFEYPSGDKGLYRPARISAPENIKDVFVAQYVLKDTNFFKTRPNSGGIIKTLNEQEYWIINKGNHTTSDVLLTLSWDHSTTDAAILKDLEHELHIVRWDETSGSWVDQGGVIDVNLQEITTPIAVSGYGYFTLARMAIGTNEESIVEVYNLVTAGNDGKNDYFLIKNINQYPNNSVEIYNRWGVKVYETKNYDSVNNVFRGYSEGRTSLGKGEKLPTGTYYYMLTYDKSDSNGTTAVKKSGYLHLETE